MGIFEKQLPILCHFIEKGVRSGEYLEGKKRLWQTMYSQARQRHALAPLEFRRSEKKVRREDDSSKKEVRSPKLNFEC